MDRWSILDRALLGSSVVSWALALTVVVAVAAGVRATLGVVGRRLGGAGEGTVRAFLATLILAARNLLVVSIALLAGASTLDLPAAPAKLVRFAAMTIMIVQVGLWSTKLVGFVLERWMKKDGRVDPASVTVASLVRFVSQGVVWIIVLLLVLDNAGVDVTALVAGLGVGGIAVALAVQNVLGDLFASLSIVVDRPFVVGDFIRVGDVMGTVERIGLKSTRLRSLTGEQLVLANSDLLSSRIHNFQRLRERRIVFGFGVLYETSPTSCARSLGSCVTSWGRSPRRASIARTSRVLAPRRSTTRSSTSFWSPTTRCSWTSRSESTSGSSTA